VRLTAGVSTITGVLLEGSMELAGGAGEVVVGIAEGVTELSEVVLAIVLVIGTVVLMGIVVEVDATGIVVVPVGVDRVGIDVVELAGSGVVAGTIVGIAEVDVEMLFGPQAGNAESIAAPPTAMLAFLRNSLRVNLFDCLLFFPDSELLPPIIACLSCSFCPQRPGRLTIGR
jgi:hypothetical protein